MNQATTDRLAATDTAQMRTRASIGQLSTQLMEQRKVWTAERKELDETRRKLDEQEAELNKMANDIDMLIKWLDRKQ